MIALVQASFPDAATAERIGRALVEERLAACVNLLGPCRSVYRWRGAVEEADEALAQFKTAPVRLRRLVERLTELHPYDFPAIDHWQVECHPDLERWVADETG